MSGAKGIYLDHAAGTFLLPQVKESLVQWLSAAPANPSSIHSAGRSAAATLDTARQTIAKSLGCKPAEIIFTSGGTEANNLGLMGAVYALADKGKHIITCATEHPSVLESCKQLQQSGFDISYLPVDENGSIDPDILRRSIREDTILISLMWINNETGLIHPIKTLAKIANDAGVRFHCDGVQALGHIPIDVNTLPIDSLALSGHKLGTPAGIGALYLRKGNALNSELHGGSQEQNFRAGTQNHIGAQALGVAVQHHQEHVNVTEQHYLALSNHLVQRLKGIPGIQLNRNGETYTPNIINCSLHNIDGEALFIRLDMKHISVSNGSACSSGSQAPSHVLTALGVKESLAQASLRISLGLESTQKEIDGFCDELEQIIHSIQKESS